MKILLTGATGFIGSHLAHQLVAQGHTVTAFSRPINSRGAKRVERFKDKVNWIFGDLADGCSGICEGQKAVFHLAAKTFVDHSIKSPESFVRDNIIGTFNLLEDARLNKVKRFFMASTDEVLGQILEGQHDERAPLCPRNPYAATKAGAEALAISYAHTYGLHTVVTRCENIYGCYSSDTEVLTPFGFVTFDRLAKGVPVATLNPTTHAFEWQIPTAYQNHHHSGKMIRFKTRQMDLLVTPDHWMYIGDRAGKNWDFQTAQKVVDGFKRQDVRFHLCSRSWNGESPLTVSKFEKLAQKRIPGHTAGFTIKLPTGEMWEFKTTDWVQFMAWYLSEGSVSKIRGLRSAQWVVQIRQTKSDNLDEIKSLVSRMGLSFSVKYGKEGRVRIFCKELAKYLTQFGQSHSKHIPMEIKEMDTDLLRLFFTTYAKGDGCFSKKRWKTKWKKRVGKITTVITSSPQMRDDLQEVSAKIGIATTSSLRPSGVYSIGVSEIYNFTRLWKQPETQDYDGPVYCVSVPNRNIFVRRNGRCTFCGNSFQHPQKVFPTFVRALLNQQKLPVYGDGQHIRQWLWVDDACDAFVFLLSKDIPPGEVIHIAGHQELTNLELAEKIIWAFNPTFNWNDHIQFVPDHDIRPGHDRRYALSTAKINDLGWSPQMSLDDGIINAVQWYLANKEWLV